MRQSSKKTGVIFDKFGSHHLEIERAKSIQTGYKVGRVPGKEMSCSVCHQLKSTIGGSKKTKRFTCKDCFEYLTNAKAGAS